MNRHCLQSLPAKLLTAPSGTICKTRAETCSTLCERPHPRAVPVAGSTRQRRGHLGVGFQSRAHNFFAIIGALHQLAAIGIALLCKFRGAFINIINLPALFAHTPPGNSPHQQILVDDEVHHHRLLKTVLPDQLLQPLSLRDRPGNNGGLGTSMGLSGPKSLLEVKPGTSFLDVIATQVLALRQRYGARLPLVLMNSAATRGPSLDCLRRYGGLPVPGVPLDFLQGREPKIRADDLQPVAWPADPELEWCPPGHGDIYTALAASGTLGALLGAGLRYAFVSNSDNLGALADVRIAAWLAAEQVPFALEAVRGTQADRKGGHLARYQGRVVLRETAQVPDGDTSFTDVERWRWYNTNNIWIDLRALRDLQADDPAAPDLPLIINRKTADPRDPASTPVIQLESAMGAAIGSIPGARAVHVPRSRFAPVKTTDDLLVVRSDAYELTSDGRMRPSFDGRARRHAGQGILQVAAGLRATVSCRVRGSSLPPIRGRRQRHLRRRHRSGGRRTGRRPASRPERGGTRPVKPEPRTGPRAPWLTPAGLIAGE